MFNTIYNIAAEALSANRLRINVISSNIANAQTTRTAEGGPYKRREVVMVATDKKREDFASALDEATLKGVKVAGVVADESAPRNVYDPSHPDADPTTGMVAMPNINAVTEMTNMVSASTAYKAAAEIVSVTKEMANALRTLAQRF